MEKSSLMGHYRLLLKKFGEQGWWPLNGRYSPAFKQRGKSGAEKFEIAAGAILTQSASWKNARKALENLRKKNALNRKSIVKMPISSLARLIRPCGYHKQKARKLKEFAKYKGRITRGGLLSIWGIGPETADSILLYAYGKPVFVVDEYTRRYCNANNIAAKCKSYDDFQEYFMQRLPKDAKIFNEFHALLVAWGKESGKRKKR